MKKINFNTILVLVLINLALFIGCMYEKKNKIKTEKIFNSFPEQTSIEGKKVEDIIFFSRGNGYICVVDTFLVLQRTKEEKFIHIYGTKNHKILAEIGTKGRGANEFISPELLNQAGYDSTNSSPVIYLYDYTRRRFSTVNILDVINNKEAAIVQDTLPNINSYLRYFFYKDQNFFIACKEDRHWPILFDFNTRKIYELPFPDNDFSLEESNIEYIYRPFVAVNNRNKRITATPFLLGKLYIYDFEGNHLSTSNFDPIANERVAHVEDIKDFKRQMLHMRAKSGLIYGLNKNCLVQDEGYLTDPEHKQKIQVFNWDGEPVKEYILSDGRSVFSFDIDVKNNRIYAYCPDEEDHSIIIYNLNNK